MNSENLTLIVLSVLFTVVGIMLLLGKADFAIKKHIRESGKFIIPRMRVINALAFFLLDIVTILILCGVNEMVTVSVVVPIVVVLIVLQYTWAKRKE
jgi:L-asparagine transporter-like permease